VPYADIQSPEAKVLEAFQKKSQFVQQRSPKISPIALLSEIALNPQEYRIMIKVFFF
jgi:hypothetical protein